MGERYQSHFIVEAENSYNDKVETHMFSVHMQWCWGSHIVRNMHRVLDTLNKSKISFFRADEFRKFVDSIFTVNCSFEGAFYPSNVHLEDAYATDYGDSNHGWNVVKIKISKDEETTITSRFYNVNGRAVSNKTLLTKSKDNIDDEDLDKIQAMLDSGLFNNTKENLQSIFNKEVEARKEAVA